MKSYSCEVLSEGEKIKRMRRHLDNAIGNIARHHINDDLARLINSLAVAIQHANDILEKDQP